MSEESEEVLTGYATRTITEPVQPPRPPAAPTHNDPKPPPPTPLLPTRPHTALHRHTTDADDAVHPTPAATPDTTEAARAAATLATGPLSNPPHSAKAPTPRSS